MFTLEAICLCRKEHTVHLGSVNRFTSEALLHVFNANTMVVELRCLVGVYTERVIVETQIKLCKPNGQQGGSDSPIHLARDCLQQSRAATPWWSEDDQKFSRENEAVEIAQDLNFIVSTRYQVS